MFHFVTSPAQSAQVFAVSLRFPVILGSAMDKDRASPFANCGKQHVIAGPPNVYNGLYYIIYTTDIPQFPLKMNTYEA